MPINKMIKSFQNSKIKQIKKLRKSSQRKKEALFLIDGYKELTLAIQAGIEIETIYYSKDFAKDKDISSFDKKLVLEVSKEIFANISYKEHPDGFLSLAKIKHTSLSDLKLGKNPLILVLEAIEKPGNIGAILRTADASGVDAVILLESKTDIYNPNVIRASLGTVFTNNIVISSQDETIKWLKQNKIKIYATTPQADNDYTEINYNFPIAVLIGTEHDGLGDKLLEIADKKIKIAMNGKIDSLNVSVSTAVVVFEAKRQRKILSTD